MPFGGSTYNRALDRVRLTGQLGRVLRLMADGRWRALNEIHRVVGGSEAAISARLRDFRKAKFGSHQMVGRVRAGHRNLWEYRLVLSQREIIALRKRIAALRKG